VNGLAVIVVVTYYFE